MSAHSESHDCTATEIVAQLRDQEAEPALGAREDFFGDDTDAGDDEQRETVGHDPEPFDYAEEKAEYAAYAFLKPIAEKVDPEALFGDPDYSDAEPELRFLAETLDVGQYALHTEQRPMAVSDPAVRLAQRIGVFEGTAAAPDEEHSEQAFGQQRRRTRYNEETGLATGPYLQSLAFEEFMTAVEAIVPYWKAELGLSEDRVGDLLHDARCMKASGNYKDLQILSQLMSDLVAEYGQEFRGVEAAREARRTADD
jgi:hypothetical protein